MPEGELNPDWWYLNGYAYDLKDFVKEHPGGFHAIDLGKGRDCTGLFESNHTNITKAYKYLFDDYKVLDSQATQYVNKINKSPFTFKKDGFYRTIKDRAKKYFESNGLQHTKGGLKEIIYFIILIIALYLSGLYGMKYSNPFCSILFGIFKSLIVVSSAHGASHYAFNKNQYVNYIVMYISMAIIGMENPSQWTTKHVINHHILTNITPVDADTIYPIKRSLPHLKRLWFHKYQHLYIWPFYVLLMIPWSITKSLSLWSGIFSENGVVFEGEVVVKYNKYEAMLNNICHHVIRWFLPFYLSPTWCSGLITFFIIEMSGSLWFSLQFAINHEVEEAAEHAIDFTDINKTPKLNKDLDWGIHQLLTSHNYSVDFTPSLHLSGGLNTQIEHHLFPSVHYKYYKDLAQIVRKTCAEFKVPYNESFTLFEALRKHFCLLKALGSYDTFEEAKFAQLKKEE